MRRFAGAAALMAAMWCGTAAWAADAENCKDHPLFSRMNNFEIHGCATTEFDSVAFPKPELKEWDAPDNYQAIEGKVHAISYQLKEGATQVSALQIVRNFQNAVKKDGGTILGDYSGEVYPSLPETAVKYLGESPSGSSFDRYTTMTLTKDGTEFWIYLCASEGDQDYMLLLVEKQEMKQEINVNPPKK
ncbi:hypothetical protein Despr_1130 [Desulfobulbus propionicus DSM 2032]|jgi:hypothetical protein|uniref:Secreted protein n=1 Tax=Desulfobulbus propionicus (strain ATCC 33891 / DSM 2032 / VKM B-1956 / 1pr3) TaxID=577650 RepID=A0A7U4DNR2_DESPD|nr:hypothetical protein [Desulfobulbus propionicus]ADW17302.1 hypothetical protein Despr_1130 [Desulfobulbus propionicus DSM 2032]